VERGRVGEYFEIFWRAEDRRLVEGSPDEGVERKSGIRIVGIIGFLISFWGGRILSGGDAGEHFKIFRVEGGGC